MARTGGARSDKVRCGMVGGKGFQIPELPGLIIPWYRRPPKTLWFPLRAFVFARDEGTCQYCGNPVKIESCHCHHVLPLSEGGTNHPTNLKTLCDDCHKQRHPFMLSAKEKFLG